VFRDGGVPRSSLGSGGGCSKTTVDVRALALAEALTDTEPQPETHDAAKATETRMSPMGGCDQGGTAEP
jgi:hypothetical protein